MAFSINIPGPKLIDLDLYGKLGDIGTAYKEGRDEALARDVFANMRSDDPASVDEAVRRLGHIPKYAALAQRMFESHQQAQERAATQALTGRGIAVQEGRFGLEKEAAERQRKFSEETLPQLLKGGGGGVTAPAVTPPVAPPYPGTEPDDVDVSSARRQPGAPPLIETAPSEDTGVDVSSAAKKSTTAASTGGFEGMTTRQLEMLAANPDAPKEVNALATMYLRQRQAEAAKQKDPADKEAEAFATARGKDLQEELGSLYRRGRDSVAEERTLLRQKALIEKQGLVTGTGIPKIMTEGAKIDVGLLDSLRSMGVPVDKIPLLGGYADWARGRVQAAEQFESLTAEGVFKKAGGSFSRITDKDREQIEKMYSRVANTTEGNLALIDYNLHMNRLDRKEAQEVQNYMRYQAKNGRPANVEEIERLRRRIQEQGARELLEHANRDRARLGSGAPRETTPRGDTPAGAPVTPDTEGWTPLPGGGRIRMKP